MLALALALVVSLPVVVVQSAVGQGTAPQGAAWSDVPSPNTGFATARLTATACSSPTDCWAVGNSVEGFTTFGTIAHWNGQSWSPATAPTAPEKLVHYYGIACAAANMCLAVGFISNIKEAFDHGQWPYLHGLVLRWDGNTWTRQDVADLPGAAAVAGNSVLRSISCSSSVDCWAVGYASTGPGEARNLLLHWTGQWSEADSSALGSGTLELGSVSCPSPSFCLAVGPTIDATVVTDQHAPTAALWDGSAWHLASAPAPALPEPASAQEQWMTGVSCVSALDCWAVGEATTSDPVTGTPLTLPVVEHWNGLAWVPNAVPQAPTNLPAAPGGLETHLTGVVCRATTNCWAIGHANGKAVVPGAVDMDFALHYDGKAWAPSGPLPDATATFDGDLAAIACPSDALCFAVGSITPADQVHGLIRKWDGAAWSSLPAPGAAQVDGNYLNGVACPAATDCWAVGMYFYGQLGRNLIEHWDGSTWTLVDAPNSAEDRYNALQGISCASASDCWAVGSSSTWNGRDVDPVALHWDGVTWAYSNPLAANMHDVQERVNGPLGGTAYTVQDASLQGIDCLAADDCWAVGFVDGGLETSNFLVGAYVDSKPLFLHWDGTAWTPATMPATQTEPLSEMYALSVSCAASDDCTAVGARFDRLEYNFKDVFMGAVPGRDQQTLVDHWDGHAWTEVVSPNLGEFSNTLFGVACAGSDCWAVGAAYLDDPYSGSPRQAPIALRSQAGAWALADLPAGAATLDAVDCFAATDCWAVGSPPGFGTTKTTGLHWDGSTWATVSTPSKQNAGKPTANNLAAVTCVSATHCLAVGNFDTGKPPSMQTLVLEYAPGHCPDGSAPPCSTTTSTTSTSSSSSSSTSASTTTGTGTAGGIVNNLGPIIDGFAAAPSQAILGKDDTVALTGTAHDDNGWESITGITTTVHAASTALTTTKTRDDADPDGVRGTFASSLALAGMTAGNYQVDAFAVDDQSVQSDIASLVVHVLPPSQVVIDYTGAAPKLDFGSFDPGAVNVASQNAFQVRNQLHQDRQFFFDMDDFVCTHGAIPVAGHATLLVGSMDENGVFQLGHSIAYQQSLVDLGVLSDGSTLAVKMVLEHVPVGIAGTCTTSFGISHT